MQDRINARIAGIEDRLVRIERGIATFLEFFAEHPSFVELLIQERAYFKDRKRPTYFEYREVNIERWRQLYRELIGAGRVRDMPVEQITDVVSNVLYGIMVTNFFNGQPKPSDVQAREILDVIFLGILSESERRRRLGETSEDTTVREPGPCQIPLSEQELFRDADNHEATLVDGHGAAAVGRCGGHRVSAGAVGSGQDDPNCGL
jgi:hypothetical protein